MPFVTVCGGHVSWLDAVVTFFLIRHPHLFKHFGKKIEKKIDVDCLYSPPNYKIVSFVLCSSVSQGTKGLSKVIERRKVPSSTPDLKFDAF